LLQRRGLVRVLGMKGMLLLLLRWVGMVRVLLLLLLVGMVMRRVGLMVIRSCPANCGYPPGTVVNGGRPPPGRQKRHGR